MAMVLLFKLEELLFPCGDLFVVKSNGDPKMLVFSDTAALPRLVDTAELPPFGTFK